jgi:hypothetical protein
LLHEWREPQHEEFEQWNVWALFNAFTAALKDGSLAELPKRTEALHGLLDSHVGLARKSQHELNHLVELADPIKGSTAPMRKRFMHRKVNLFLLAHRFGDQLKKQL